MNLSRYASDEGRSVTTIDDGSVFWARDIRARIETG